MSNADDEFEREPDLGDEFASEPEHGEEAKAKPPTVGAWTTGAMHYGDDAAFGAGDKIRAGVQALTDVMHDKTGKVTLGDAYRRDLDFNKKLLEDSDKEHPAAKWIGKGLGIGTNLAATAGMGGGWKGAAGVGALYGAPEAADEAAHGNYGKAAVAIPASAAASVALHGLSAPIAQFLSSRMGNAAGRLAYKAAGPMLKDVRRVGVEGAQATGNRLLDMGAVKALDNPEAIANRLGPMAQATGEKLGNIRQLADKLGATAEPSLLSEQISSDVAGPLADSPALGGYAQRFENYADKVRDMSPNGQPVKFSKLAEERINLDKLVKHAKRNASPSEQGWRDVRGILSDAENQSIKSTSPTLAEEYANAKHDYAIQKPVAEMANDMASRMQSNRFISLGDRVGGGVVGAIGGASSGSSADDGSGLMGGIVGGGAGAAAGAMGGAFLSRALRTRGAATGAVAARGVSNLLKSFASNPALAGRWAPAFEKAAASGTENAVFAAHHALADRDPEYRAHVQEQLKQASNP